MRYAYADPPYLGESVRMYGDHPNAAVYDTLEGHAALIDSLAAYDGWALSLHVPSLQRILPLCPEDVRVAAWCKPWSPFRKGVRVHQAWEPVIYRGHRAFNPTRELTIRDWLITPITMRQPVRGAKPEPFCRWIIDLLGLIPGDTLDDLFPGSGAMDRAVTAWKLQQPLPTQPAIETLALP